MIILVDMDEVLAGFTSRFREHWQASGREWIDQYTWEILDHYPEDAHEDIWNIWELEGFFHGLEPIPGGREALEEMDAFGHDVFICTSPIQNHKNCVGEKYQWVEDNLGHEWTRKIILTKDKTLVKGDFLIDDKPVITGVAKPEWQHVLFNRGFNQDEFLGDLVLHDWSEWRNILRAADSG